MIDNYLVDARQRFDLDNEMKAKQKLVTNSPHVFTNLKFPSYDFILRIFVMIAFLIGKLRKNCLGAMGSLFSLPIAQTEKFVEKIREKKW